MFLILPCVLLAACATFSARDPASQIEKPIEKIGIINFFEKHEIPEKSIIYYLHLSSHSEAPLILYIQGSGCDSIFLKDARGFVNGGQASLIASIANGRASVLAVEKPTLKTYDQSSSDGNVSDCSQQFREEFNRDTWVKTLQLTLNHVSKIIHPSKVFVLGHSEGASMAAALASEAPQVVKVIYAAGGGGNPLFGSFTRRIRAANGNQVLADSYIQSGIKEWQVAMKNPSDSNNILWGHTAQYWSIEAKNSPIKDMLKTSANFYIIQGTEDTSTSIESTDYLVSELVTAGRPITYRRIAGADHGFTINGQSNMREEYTKAIAWALGH